MAIFFTSDLHLGHAKVLLHHPETRPWRDVETMNEALVKHWNNKVGPEDEIYLLGDVSFMKSGPTLELLKRLNGKKHLILGNHDYGLNQEHRDLFESVQPYLEKKIDGIWVMMMHFPIFQWNKMQHGSFHLYGHMHGGYMPEMTGRCMDVGWDAHGELVEWERVKEYLQDKPVRPHFFGKAQKQSFWSKVKGWLK